MDDKEKNSPRPSALDNLFEALEQEADRGKQQVQAPLAAADSGGLTGALDLTDPLRDIYLLLLRKGEMSIAEMQADPEFGDPDFLPSSVKILKRQSYLEAKREGDCIRYRAISGERTRKTVSDDIWDALG